MTAPPPSVDPTALDRLLEMTGGDPTFLDELIQTYLDDAEVQLEAMRRAAEAGVAEDLLRPAHSLKGNSASMGAEVLAERCRELETDARSGRVADAVERVAAAAAEFQRVRSELTAPRGAT